MNCDYATQDSKMMFLLPKQHTHNNKKWYREMSE